MILYSWEKCSTCREANRLLAKRAIPVEGRDLFSAPLSAAELDDLAAPAGGLKAIASTASPRFWARGLKLDEWSDDDLRTAMVEDPHLIKRPILRLDDGSLLVGLPAITKGLAGLAV